MRKSVASYLTVPALFLAGCGESHPHAKNPAPAPAPVVQPPAAEFVTIEAEKGPVKVGPAAVSVKRVWETKYEGVPTLSVAIRVECPKDGTPFVIKGWSADYSLVEKLAGKRITDKHAGPDPLPVTFGLTADDKEKCRGLMRIINHDPERTKQKVEVGTLEMKVNHGGSLYLLYQFERPGPYAKELVMEFAGEDVGHTGRVRVRIPAAVIVRE